MPVEMSSILEESQGILQGAAGDSPGTPFRAGRNGSEWSVIILTSFFKSSVGNYY